MIFGSTDVFAIEIGAIESYPDMCSPYVQFRFWIKKVPIGDWEDRISLIASTENARIFCATEEFRHASRFGQNTPSEIFQRAYDDFFSWDYTKNQMIIPNLRDRFHLDGIGMGVIQDKYGLVLVESTDGGERIIAKDLIQEQFIGDVLVSLGLVESVLRDYIEWGKTQLPAG